MKYLILLVSILLTSCATVEKKKEAPLITIPAKATKSGIEARYQMIDKDGNIYLF